MSSNCYCQARIDLQAPTTNSQKNYSDTLPLIFPVWKHVSCHHPVSTKNPHDKPSFSRCYHSWWCTERPLSGIRIPCWEKFQALTSPEPFTLTISPTLSLTFDAAPPMGLYLTLSPGCEKSLWTARGAKSSFSLYLIFSLIDSCQNCISNMLMAEPTISIINWVLW